MSPIVQDISDHESENQERRRGRPATSVARLLQAADAMLAAAPQPQAVTMEAIAEAAAVGKATLFRAFGSRDGLLDALWTRQLDRLRDALATKASALGAGVAPRRRVAAFLDALLHCKLDNRHLLRARETASGLMQSPNYLWMHATLAALLHNAAPKACAGAIGYAAHALLATLHIDLIEALLAAGMDSDDISRAQTRHARAMIADLRD